jgi:hypothetical protein
MTLRETQAAHWAKKDGRIIQTYWISPPATKRSQWFVEQLKSYQFNSIFEVGFFSGRNLKYIQDAFANVSICGIDVNKEAVEFAREKLPKADLSELDINNLNEVDSMFDIVFTSGVLIHIPPENLKESITKMMKKASKYIMHIESMGNNELIAGPKYLNPTYKISDQLQWSPNLRQIYDEMKCSYKIIELPKDVRTNGASELVIVDVQHAA